MRSPRHPIRLLLPLTLVALATASWAQDPDLARADDLVAIAQRDLARGDARSATSELSRAAELRPDWTTPHAILALAYQAADREADALAEYKAVQEASWPAPARATQPRAVQKIDERKAGDGLTDEPDADASWANALSVVRPKSCARKAQPKERDPRERGSREQVIAAEARLMWLVNRERSERDLGMLRPEALLGIVARRHSDEMRDLGYFSHHSPVPGNETVMKRFDRTCGFEPRLVAENLARRWGSDFCFCLKKVESSHNDLMESPGHRQNILREGICTIGVGIAVDSAGAYWITEVFAQCDTAALEAPIAKTAIRPR